MDKISSQQKSTDSGQYVELNSYVLDCVFNNFTTKKLIVRNATSPLHARVIGLKKLKLKLQNIYDVTKL